LKIANITEEGRGGGPLFGMLTTAIDLKSVGVNSTIIFPYFGSEKFKVKLDANGIDYRQLRLHHLTKYAPHLIKYCFWFFVEIIMLVRLFRKENYDIVLCHGSWQIKGIIAAKLTGIPSIWHMNDSQQPNAVKKLFKVFSGLPSAYLFASNKSREYYSDINKNILSKPNQVIQSPINIERFTQPKSDPTELQSSQAIKLITVSYLNANKNVELIIQALVKLQEQGIKNIELYIVGPILESQASYKSELDAIIESGELNTIHFLGYRTDIPELLRDADVYICSSNFESSPIAVWEAMVSGTMVITTEVGDVLEIVRENEAGIVTDTGNVGQMADAIKGALDSDQRNRYSLRGKQIATQFFESKEIANQIKQFSRDVISA